MWPSLLTKGLAFGETAAILFLVFLLLATRRQFTRPAAFLRQPFTVSWSIAIAAVIAAAAGIMFFAFRDVAYVARFGGSSSSMRKHRGRCERFSAPRF